MDAGALVSNGTDTPVEDVNPYHSLYSSVTRKHPLYTFPEFYPEQSMTRTEALISYTLSPAFAAFEENVKGSLEVGKYADVAILDTNLMNCTDDAIINTKAMYTILDGKIVYKQSHIQ